MAADELAIKTVGLRNRTTWQKTIETGALVLSWMVMGMYCETSGPTLIDLKYRLNTSYEDLAVALSAAGGGTFPGCIIGGFLVDKFSGYSHLTLALALDIAAASVVLIPWVPNVQYLWILSFTTGFVLSIHNAAGTRINLNIWKESSASPMILMHLGYGIGSLITPLYSNPFLGVEVQNGNESVIMYSNTSTSINTTNVSYSTAEKFSLNNSRVEYAYAISAIATAGLSVVFFVFQFIENKIVKQLKDVETRRRSDVDNERISEIHNETDNEQFKFDSEEKDDKCNRCKGLLQMINPASCAKGRFWYGTSILIFMFFFFGNVGGGQRVVTQFIRSFSIDQLNFSSTDGSLLNTSLWISFSVGRLFFFVIARCVSVKVLLILETGGFMCSAILMAIFANGNSTALWVLIQPVAFFIGPLWPTGVAWTDYHIELTGMGIASQMLGSSVGFVCHLQLIGYMYDNIGPQTYVYHVAGSAIFGFVLAVALALIGAKHGNRFDSGSVDLTTE
ncbi:sodium-dependent glucose transporter 1-like [Mercenaria mercenaria]|uniref:sodium-dependent glucose transporter 1-like n=1 Tax=Mercenaria mercenaria TaxID=6596 RepID=UPI00234F2186|nr:sodium-dependent glucose transporter 1-like [Mercenaria mercenaria]XP_053393328.1 sodium-dependent glucose transporter 1-like [Mercenaria mercenaria]